MNDDVIRLRNMLFHAFHGVYDAERQIGQRFEVDVEIYRDISFAAETDQLAETIDLYKVHALVESVVTGEQFKLVETLAERIGNGMLKQFEIPKVLIRVRKPNSPVKGIAGGLEVEIVRTALES